MRRILQNALVVLAAAALCAVPAADVRADDLLWPMFFGDARGTCSSPMVGVRGSPEIDWELSPGSTGRYAIGADDCLYVSTSSQQDFLRTIRPDGVLQWSVPGGGMTPAFGADGTMYSYRRGELSAYAPQTLGLLWETWGGTLGREVVVAADGTILSLCNQWGLRAFEPNGTRRWWSDNSGYGVCVVSDDGRVYCSDQYIRDRVYALDLATGDVLWTRTMPLDVSRLMVASDGTLRMTGDLTGADGVGVRALNPDGSEAWMKTYPDAYPTRGAALRADDVLCFSLLGDGAGVYALAPNGTQLWSTPLANMADRYLTVDAEGKVYGGLSGGSDPLYCLAADGDVEWIFSPAEGNAGFGNPVSIGRDGTLYLVGSGRIRAVGTNAPSATPEPMTLSLVVVGSAGVIWSRRRRREVTGG